MLNLLYIEDNEDDVTQMERHLRETPLKDYKLHSVSSVREAIAYSAPPANRPDLVYMDLDIRDGRGQEVFEKYHSVYQSVPIIVVSGAYNSKMKDLLMRAGASDYIDKADLQPNNILFKATERALSRHRRIMDNIDTGMKDPKPDEHKPPEG